MANINITRIGEIAQKKVKRVLGVEINAAFFVAAGITPATGTANYLAATLPERAVITDAYVVVRTVASSATSAVVNVGTAEGGAQIIAAADIKAATGVIGTLVGKRDTGTGQDIYVQTVYTGATTNFGDYTVVIEYTEYEKNSGEYTKFS